jgi:hypothetical protein
MKDALGINWYGPGGGAPALSSAAVAKATDDALNLIFNRAVTLSDDTGFSIVTDGASAITISSVSGSGTTTPSFQLSRVVEQEETLYLVYDGTGDLAAGGTEFEAFEKAITNNVTLMFNGISQYGSFGDILDSVIAAADTYFELEIQIDNIGAGARRLIHKKDTTANAGFDFLLDASHNPFLAYNTNGTNRRSIVGTTAVQNGDTLTLKYDGSIDTGDGLNRVTFEINGTPIGKTLSFTTGTLPANIPNVADFLGFADIVNELGVNNGVAMYRGDAFNLVVRSVGPVDEINVPDLETGTDTSGNGNDMTFTTRVPAFTTYTTFDNDNIIPQFTDPNDWHGRGRIVERNGVWIMAFIEGDEHTGDGSQGVNMAFSTNKGGPWLAKNTFTDGTDISFFPAKNGESIGDINLILCPNNDLVLIGHLRDATTPFGFLTMVQSRSTDGGKNWSAWVDIGSQFEGPDTNKWASFDFTTDGTNVYIPISLHEGNLLTSAKCMLYKSADNCATWTKVSDITAFVDITWEAGIEWLGGTTILSVIRTSALNEAGARVRISTDMGANWSNLSNISISSKGLHQPRVKKFANEARVYVSGRIYDNATAQRNGFLYSDNNGTSWTLVEDTAIASTDDGGYADLMKRADNVFAMIAYSGELGVDGDLRQYIIKAT